MWVLLMISAVLPIISLFPLRENHLYFYTLLQTCVLVDFQLQTLFVLWTISFCLLSAIQATGIIFTTLTVGKLYQLYVNPTLERGAGKSGKKSLGTDMHSVTAAELSQGRPGLVSRDMAKAFNYARIYGSGKGLARNMLSECCKELSDGEIKLIIDKMFGRTKGDIVFSLTKLGRRHGIAHGLQHALTGIGCQNIGLTRERGREREREREREGERGEREGGRWNVNDRERDMNGGKVRARIKELWIKGRKG
eukprot:sb/3468728/